MTEESKWGVDFRHKANLQGWRGGQIIYEEDTTREKLGIQPQAWHVEPWLSSRIHFSKDWGIEEPEEIQCDLDCMKPDLHDVRRFLEEYPTCFLGDRCSFQVIWRMRRYEDPPRRNHTPAYLELAGRCDPYDTVAPSTLRDYIMKHKGSLG